MKVCPHCSKTYEDGSLNYCLDDGTPLQAAAAGNTTADTAILNSALFNATPTVSMDMGPTRGAAVPLAYQDPIQPRKSRGWVWVLLILAGMVLLCGGGIVGLGIYGSRLAAMNSNASASTQVRTPSPSPTDEMSFADTPTPAGAGYTLTMDQYRKISNGMNRSEVERILGGEGTQISSSSGGDTTYTVDQWETDDYKSIILSFKDDKVISKAQAGLK